MATRVWLRLSGAVRDLSDCWAQKLTAAKLSTWPSEFSGSPKILLQLMVKQRWRVFGQVLALYGLFQSNNLRPGHVAACRLQRTTCARAAVTFHLKLAVVLKRFIAEVQDCHSIR